MCFTHPSGGEGERGLGEVGRGCRMGGGKRELREVGKEGGRVGVKKGIKGTVKEK